MTKLIETIFSYDGDVFLAGIVFLLLVILFVLLLHIYAKWFLAHARHRRITRSTTVSQVLAPTPLRHINSLTLDATLFTSPAKGLDASAIASIPLFVYDSVVDQKNGLECVICLSLFEDQEVGRKLPNCGHEFHVECIDMWLSSHSNCPICRRAGVGFGGVGKVVEIDSTTTSNRVVGEESELGIVVEAVDSFENGNGVEGRSDSSSAVLSSSSSSLSSQVAAMGESFKRMVSRNICDRKIHPSSSDFQGPED
ncbi:hypothetical protein Vadar_020738 [Vaccinium darrowii]|uniref:Uncharacterized protein n=1 Tax=Vaccinium darrowii TaxID=229202 RepID=A0ACB7ZE41_9ERIC|nr:hypothetical protein Vadar_020738 [Vaccinium darrowii]